MAQPSTSSNQQGRVPSGKEPPAELALDELFLQLIPNSLRSVLSLAQVDAWGAVGNSLDFIWSILPPKTAQKFSELPSRILQRKIKEAGDIQSHNLNPLDNEVRQSESIDQAGFVIGRAYAFEWIHEVVEQLNKDGYLFEGTRVVMTEDKSATDQPPQDTVGRTASRSAV